MTHQNHVTHQNDQWQNHVTLAGKARAFVGVRCTAPVWSKKPQHVLQRLGLNLSAPAPPKKFTTNVRFRANSDDSDSLERLQNLSQDAHAYNYYHNQYF